MEPSFKLIEFNVYDNKSENTKKNIDVNDEVHSFQSNTEFIIQMFGINELGETCAIFVKEYNPFFYISIPFNWKLNNMLEFISDLRERMGNYYGDSIVSSKIVKHKKLYGFNANNLHKFILIKFSSEKAMKCAIKCWYIEKTINKIYNKTLNPLGYEFDGVNLQIYESNIPPLLRMFHIKEISPSGWITFASGQINISRKKKTTCKFEFTISYNNIIAMPDKETIVPYKIASFDIEASSSHGDFPVPIKNYKKLAQNIIELNIKSEYECDEPWLEDVILTSFGFESLEDVDRVYPKVIPSLPYIKELIAKILLKKIKIMKNIEEDKDISDNEEEEDKEEGFVENSNECDENIFWKKNKIVSEYKNKTASIIEIINDDTYSHDTKILELTNIFSEFPQLKGDEVTFIGTTFITYGNQSTTPRNTCLVVGSCDNVENAEIQSFMTEKQLLCAWTQLISRENPDIIIGYNIFGFDYEFMFKRAIETSCLNAFLRLSRNIGEDCCGIDWRTQKRTLDGGVICLSSGQYDLKFIKMNGRFQIDLYNYFRRDYILNSYKLDYVASYFIGDIIKKIEYIDGNTKLYSKNLIGLENNSFISFEEISHSSDYYKNGEKFRVFNIDIINGTFMIQGIETPNMDKIVKWGMSKDDITPQDIFRMTNGTSADRAIIAKYCIQDCNLVHHLMKKMDVLTGYIEMSNLCSVPLSYLVMRGQGIKLTSYVAKKCREKNTLIPVIEKKFDNSGYEGAIVLPPKCGLYLDNPIACVDFGSLYPSSMISENISHDSKIWTKEFNLENVLIIETGEKDSNDIYIYDNLPGYKYVDITYDTYTYRRKTPSAAAVKVKCGYKICRFAQSKNGRAIMPAILEELLAARKFTRKQAALETDEFMKNVLDKRQISIKLTANSLYGQCGAKTSTFYDKDVAASTTATGRKLLIYAKNVIELAYKNRIIDTSLHGNIRVNAEYIYGDTDSVFFTFNCEEIDGTKIIGQRALEITIELAQQAGALATKFLKQPHDLEYEKTFLPFCLLSKKRYVGMMYEFSPDKCFRKSMGIVLKRRDNAPIVKDIYGGLINILMNDKNIIKSREFLENHLQQLVEEKYSMEKLIISKALRSGYKNPTRIAHKVLADRMGKRDPGNKPGSGDRIQFVYIKNSNTKALQGDRIENPLFIKTNNIKIDYAFYITNQIMKPIQQLFALVLEEMPEFKRKKDNFIDQLNCLKQNLDEEKYKKKEIMLRNKEIKTILFDKYIKITENKSKGQSDITSFLIQND